VGRKTPTGPCSQGLSLVISVQYCLVFSFALVLSQAIFILHFQIAQLTSDDEKLIWLTLVENAGLTPKRSSDAERLGLVRRDGWAAPCSSAGEGGEWVGRGFRSTGGAWTGSAAPTGPPSIASCQRLGPWSNTRPLSWPPQPGARAPFPACALRHPH